MKDLIFFEIKKSIKTLYFIMLIIALISFISFYFIYSYTHTERVDDYINKNETIKSNFQLTMDKLRNAEENGTDNTEEMDFFINQIKELDILSEAARNHDWSTILNHEIAIGEDLVNVSIQNVYTWPTHFTNEVVYEKNKWLLEHNIKPVFPIHNNSEITVYDSVFNTEADEEIAHDFSNKHDSSSVYFLYLLFGVSLNFGGAIFFLFLFGNMITREGLSRNGPIFLLGTLPLKNWKIIWSKLITVASLTLLVLLATSLWGGFLSIIFDRFGDWNYPVLVYEPDASFQFMEMGTVILLSLLLFFVVLIFCYSWLFLYSVLVKQTFMTIVLTIMTLSLGVLISGSDIVRTQALAQLNPFHYFHIIDIVTMKYAVTAENFDLNIKNGIFSLVISSFILVITSYLIFNKRFNPVK